MQRCSHGKRALPERSLGNFSRASCGATSGYSGFAQSWLRLRQRQVRFHARLGAHRFLQVLYRLLT